MIICYALSLLHSIVIPSYNPGIATSEPKQVIFMDKQSAPQYTGRIAPHSFSLTTLKSNAIQFRTNSDKCAEIIIPDKYEKKLLVDLKKFR